MAILFDLDGTLLDSAPDMLSALNQTLAEFGKTKMSIEQIRPHVSFGAASMVAKAFNISKDDSAVVEYKEKFLQYYRETQYNNTKPFTGIELLITKLNMFKVPWGIVTNKKGEFAIPALEKWNLAKHAGCCVYGDTTEHIKPHPAPLLHACSILNVKPSDCIYIGDALTDIQAGKNAGMTTIAALFGYIGDLEKAKLWPANYAVTSASQLWRWIVKCLHQ